jgi:hypothetical protein
MAKVRAKEPCYLNETGYKTPDDGEFNYNGPEHDSLEYLDRERVDNADVKYHTFSREELKTELGKRKIEFQPNAPDKKLRELLEADDSK